MGEAGRRRLLCDLAVFVNRHTLPSGTVTDERHRERKKPPRVIVYELIVVHCTQRSAVW